MRTYKIIVVPGESGRYEISRNGIACEAGEIQRIQNFLRRKGKSEEEAAPLLKQLADFGEVEVSFPDDSRQ
ncbi:MAG: hypothetical protein JWO13_1392 [Acidobacteriales bacterium]|nr:hypothetical protein [Terriglobales bacterium]